MTQEFSERPLFAAKSSVNALLRFYMLSSFYITITTVLFIMWIRYTKTIKVLDTPIGEWPSGIAVCTAGFWLILTIHFIRQLIACAKRFRLFEISHFMISSRNLRYIQCDDIRLINLFTSKGLIELPLEKITDKSYQSVFEDYGTIILSTSTAMITRDYMYMPQNVMNIITQSKDVYHYETGSIENMHLEKTMVQSNAMLGSQLENMTQIMENISNKMPLGYAEPEKIEEKSEKDMVGLEVKEQQDIEKVRDIE